MLLLITIFGLLLRGLNSTFGSPSLYVSNDEAIAHLSAFNMIVEKTPVSIANYTPLGAYLQIPFLIASYFLMRILRLVDSLPDFELFALTHGGYFLFIPRLISAFFGSLMILIIYKITILLLHTKGHAQARSIALIAAFLTAVSFNLVHVSHFGRPWSASLFFSSLAIYWALKRRVFYSMIFLVISFGFHQSAILILPLILFLLKKIGIKNLIFVLVLGLLLMLSLNSLTLQTGVINAINKGQSFLKPDTVLADIVGSSLTVNSFTKTISENLYVYFLKNFLVTDGIVAVFAFYAAFFLFKESFLRKYILFILAYFIFGSLFFYPLLRYLLPIILMTIPLAAFGVFEFASKMGKIKLLFIMAILTVSSINSIWWNWLWLKTPTFIQAHEWVNKHIPADKPIAYIGGRFATFAPGGSSAQHMQTVNPGFYRRLRAKSPDDSFDNIRNIIYVSQFPGKDKFEQLQKATFNYPVEYVIDYYLDPKERLYNFRPESFEILAQFNPVGSGELVGLPEPIFDASWNFPTNDARPKVSMYSLARIGPYIDILRVRNY